MSSHGYRGRRGGALARYEDIRKDRTAMVVQKPHENRKQVFSPALANKDEVAPSVTQDWQQGARARATGFTPMTRRRLRFDRLGYSRAAKPRRGGITTRCLILFLRVGPR